jgi:hypothetical protein
VCACVSWMFKYLFMTENLRGLGFRVSGSGFSLRFRVSGLGKYLFLTDNVLSVLSV